MFSPPFWLHPPSRGNYSIILCIVWKLNNITTVCLTYLIFRIFYAISIRHSNFYSHKIERKIIMGTLKKFYVNNRYFLLLCYLLYSVILRQLIFKSRIHITKFHHEKPHVKFGLKILSIPSNYITSVILFPLSFLTSILSMEF